MTADLEQQQQTKQSNATTTYHITRIVPRSALPGEVVKVHGVFPYVNTECSDIRAKCPISLHFPGHQMVYPDAIEVLDAKPGFCTVVSLTIPPAYKGLENDKVHIFLFVNGRIIPSERPVKFQYRTTIRRIEWAACSIPLLPHQPAGGSERKKISTLNGILSQQIPRSVYGRTILHLFALERKDQKVISLLRSIVCPRQRKQIVNISDNAGYSLLHIAAARGCLDLAKTLLQMGADPTLKCNRGQTPSDLCAHTPLLQRILLLASQLYPTSASPSVSPSSISASCPSESRQPLAPLSYITTSVIPTTPVSSLLVKRSFEVSVKEDPTMRKRRKFF